MKEQQRPVTPSRVQKMCEKKKKEREGEQAHVITDKLTTQKETQKETHKNKMKTL